jgi:hypothetical protein
VPYRADNIGTSHWEARLGRLQRNDFHRLLVAERVLRLLKGV